MHFLLALLAALATEAKAFTRWWHDEIDETEDKELKRPHPSILGTAIPPSRTSEKVHSVIQGSRVDRAYSP